MRTSISISKAQALLKFALKHKALVHKTKASYTIYTSTGIKTLRLYKNKAVLMLGSLPKNISIAQVQQKCQPIAIKLKGELL